jgi:hypothetical protein
LKPFAVSRLFFLTLREQANQSFGGQQLWLRRLEDDHDNYAALRALNG